LIKRRKGYYATPGPDCLSHPRSLKPLNTSEILWPARNTVMASGKGYHQLVLDHKAGTSGTDNRLKIACYPKTSGQLNKRK
jgi:hypothetical protein